MPSRLPGPCGAPGCPKMRPCPDHPVVYEPRPPNTRNITQAGYGADWARVRRAHLERHPHCELCGDVASVVHHRLPIATAPLLRLDPSNLVSMCRACHERHHGRKRTT